MCMCGRRRDLWSDVLEAAFQKEMDVALYTIYQSKQIRKHVISRETTVVGALRERCKQYVQHFGRAYRRGRASS